MGDGRDKGVKDGAFFHRWIRERRLRCLGRDERANGRSVDHRRAHLDVWFLRSTIRWGSGNRSPPEDLAELDEHLLCLQIHADRDAEWNDLLVWIDEEREFLFRRGAAVDR